MKTIKVLVEYELEVEGDCDPEAELLKHLGKAGTPISRTWVILANSIEIKQSNGLNLKENMERCPKCNSVIIPEEVFDIWEKKYGARDTPYYAAICRICGKTAGEHYGTECPRKETAMLIKDGWEIKDEISGLTIKVIEDEKANRLRIDGLHCVRRDFWFTKDGKFTGTGTEIKER